nr:unnamed protein product [Trichobilharzia regenti]
MLSARDAYRLQTLARRGQIETTEEGNKLLGKLKKSLDSSNTTNDGSSTVEIPIKENMSTPPASPAAMLSARDAYRLQTLARRGQIETTEEGNKLLGKLKKSLDSSNTTNDGSSTVEIPIKENVSTPRSGQRKISEKRKRVGSPFPKGVKRPNRALSDLGLTMEHSILIKTKAAQF